jgi:hypothetical protein
MSRWLVADSLMCPEAFPFGHLDSYSHYLREYGESVSTWCMSHGALSQPVWDSDDGADVLFALDQYDRATRWPATKRIAQVAAICNPMPWDVRKPDGSPAYDLIVSSLPWMVDEARAKGCRAEYQPLAFDTRARVCKRVHKAVVESKCGPQCSNQRGKHFCPPSGMGSCAVFKGYYVDGLKDFLADPKAWECETGGKR